MDHPPVSYDMTTTLFGRPVKRRRFPYEASDGSPLNEALGAAREYLDDEPAVIYVVEGGYVVSDGGVAVLIAEGGVVASADIAEVRDDLDEAQLDPQAATELQLFIDNDANLYRQMTMPIYKNLANKMAGGKYSSSLAVKAFMHLAQEGAKRYAKQHSNAVGDWKALFSVPTRKKVAEELRDEFEAEARRGNYDDLLQKQYKSKGVSLKEDMDGDLIEAGHLFGGVGFEDDDTLLDEFDDDLYGDAGDSDATLHYTDEGVAITLDGDDEPLIEVGCDLNSSTACVRAIVEAIDMAEEEGYKLVDDLDEDELLSGVDIDEGEEWTIVKDPQALKRAMALAKGNYQRALLSGEHNLSGSTLSGAAKKYSGKYKKSTASLLRALSDAGIPWSEKKGGHGKRLLVIGEDEDIDEGELLDREWDAIDDIRACLAVIAEDEPTQAETVVRIAREFEEAVNDGDFERAEAVAEPILEVYKKMSQSTRRGRVRALRTGMTKAIRAGKQTRSEHRRALKKQRIKRRLSPGMRAKERRRKRRTKAFAKRLRPLSVSAKRESIDEAKAYPQYLVLWGSSEAAARKSSGHGRVFAGKDRAQAIRYARHMSSSLPKAQDTKGVAYYVFGIAAWKGEKPKLELVYSTAAKHESIDEFDLDQLNEVKLGKQDRAVIDAFINGKSGDGPKLTSNGKRLDGNWMGGKGIAQWGGGRIAFGDLGSKSAQTVQSAIRRAAPKNKLSEDYEFDLDEELSAEQKGFRKLFDKLLGDRDLGDMSDKEKKAFFNKVKAAWAKHSANEPEKDESEDLDEAGKIPTWSGSSLPPITHAVYTARQRVARYNGAQSPLSMHGTDGGKILAQRFPGWGRAQHSAAAKKHEKKAAKLDREWSKVVNDAAQETWGRKYRVTDYRVSGIASSEFSDKHKDALRHAAQTATKHRDAAQAHAGAANMRSLGETDYDDELRGSVRESYGSLDEKRAKLPELEPVFAIIAKGNPGVADLLRGHSWSLLSRWASSTTRQAGRDRDIPLSNFASLLSDYLHMPSDKRPKLASLKYAAERYAKSRADESFEGDDMGGLAAEVVTYLINRPRADVESLRRHFRLSSSAASTAIAARNEFLEQGDADAEGYDGFIARVATALMQDNAFESVDEDDDLDEAILNYNESSVAKFDREVVGPMNQKFDAVYGGARTGRGGGRAHPFKVPSRNVGSAQRFMASKGYTLRETSPAGGGKMLWFVRSSDESVEEGKGSGRYVVIALDPRGQWRSLKQAAVKAGAVDTIGNEGAVRAYFDTREDMSKFGKFASAKGLKVSYLVESDDDLGDFAFLAEGGDDVDEAESSREGAFRKVARAQQRGRTFKVKQVGPRKRWAVVSVNRKRPSQVHDNLGVFDTEPEARAHAKKLGITLDEDADFGDFDFLDEGYQEIKHTLGKAGKLIDQGKLDTADQLIRGLKGVSAHDVSSNLTSGQMAKMRKWVKAGKPKSESEEDDYDGPFVDEAIDEASGGPGWIGSAKYAKQHAIALKTAKARAKTTGRDFYLFRDAKGDVGIWSGESGAPKPRDVYMRVTPRGKARPVSEHESVDDYDGPFVDEAAPKQVSLSFADQASLPRKPGEITPEIHAWAVKKFAKGASASITNASAAKSRGKMGSKEITITRRGNMLIVRDDKGGGMSVKPTTTFYELRESTFDEASRGRDRAKAMGIQSPNSSGQGEHRDAAKNPYHAALTKAGLTYSHSTPVGTPGGEFRLHHSYQYGEGGFAVGVWQDDRGRWVWNGGVMGSGRKTQGNNAGGLAKYLKGATSRARGRQRATGESVDEPEAVVESFAEARQLLRRATRLAESGQLRDADALVQEAAALGATDGDIEGSLSETAFRKLRDWKAREIATV